MSDYGILSLVPPLVAIALAIRTKQVHVSLLLGIWIGWLVIEGGHLWRGSLRTIEALVGVFAEAGNTRTIMFCALVGGLIIFIQRSGGVEGFIRHLNRLLLRFEAGGSGRDKIVVQLLAWLTGLLIFVESSISVLTVGTLYRPVFDRMGISREKLAWIADSSSAPSSILVPFNGWGAFIMGLLAADFAYPFATMFRAMPWNFYPMLALLLVAIFVWWGKDIGPMRAAERRVREEGKLLPDDATPMVSEALTEVPAKEGVVPRARNMVVPIAVMVGMMPVMLAVTGWDAAMSQHPEAAWADRLFFAIGQGSGSQAVLIAVLSALLVSMIYYRAQGIMCFREMTELTLKGISGLMPLALLMMLAFAISAVCKQLGTGPWVASVAEQWLSPKLVPLILFLVSSFIAFSTGTSWGTFAIMMAIAIPMARQLDANVYLAIAAVMGGGVFGDHCSPISDTTILSSMASACDHIDHVRTQLPYALLAGGVTALLYLLVGLLAG